MRWRGLRGGSYKSGGQGSRGCEARVVPSRCCGALTAGAAALWWNCGFFYSKSAATATTGDFR